VLSAAAGRLGGDVEHPEVAPDSRMVRVGWCRSCCDIGWLSSMVLGLVVGGAEVAEGGVAAARVVEALDEREDRVRQAFSSGPGRAVEQFGLQGGEEALGDAVVEAVTDRAHRPEQPGLAKSVPERAAGVGRPVVAVVNRVCRWSAIPDRHLQGVDDQLGTDVVGARIRSTSRRRGG
jgi:hypothetical protein